jgi:hypothetical protein
MSKRIWSIEFDREASRELDDLDGQIAKRILRFLNERLSQLENPRSIGESLKGSATGEKSIGDSLSARTRCARHGRQGTARRARELSMSSAMRWAKNAPVSMNTRFTGRSRADPRRPQPGACTCRAPRS